MSIELCNYLKDCVEHHIYKADQEYSDCFKANGLK